MDETTARDSMLAGRLERLAAMLESEQTWWREAAGRDSGASATAIAVGEGVTQWLVRELPLLHLWASGMARIAARRVGEELRR